MDTRNNTSPSGANAVDASQEALRLWAQNNKELLEVFLDAFCIVDTENRVVDFNVAFTELCGESYRKILKIGDFGELVKLTGMEAAPAKRVISEARAIRIDELEGATKAYPHLQMILGGVPIRDGTGKVLGTLLTIRNVSAETELQKKYEERKKESIMDGLTRLHNKVYTEAMLLRMTRALTRDMAALTVVMIDIDHFKKVNDTYGHQAGDYVLSIVAQMLQGESRDTDIVGRFGGEEFMALLGNTDQRGAMVFAERFRKRVEAAEIVFEGKRIPVTVSLGSASSAGVPANDAVEETAKTLVSRADTALYSSKANGRNRVTQQEEIAASAMPKAATK